VAERLVLLEETLGALRALFAGDAWPGGAQVPALAGPLLPPGSPALWVGGLSDAVIGVAAREADAWNGWGLDVEAFAVKVATLREHAGGRDVTPTWGGIALVGEDPRDLDRLVAARAEHGLSLDGVWTGTAEDLRAFAAALEDMGAGWFVVLPVGPSDRLELIARTLGA
jgi:alkanesulfonate monooxygenase SsuD/methylene tetrahydromethanopterin reductase-like flavin-dependent oxidoreductase (luciferase family)